MQSIKSYTDLSQSHKLAEILPIESADMYYPNRIDIKYQGALPIEFKRGNPLLSQEIAAWSLSALLGILPNGYVIVKNYHNFYYVESRDHVKSTTIFNNPVDACYEMILKLNKLNLL